MENSLLEPIPSAKAPDLGLVSVRINYCSLPWLVFYAVWILNSVLAGITMLSSLSSFGGLSVVDLFGERRDSKLRTEWGLVNVRTVFVHDICVFSSSILGFLGKKYFFADFEFGNFRNFGDFWGKNIFFADFEFGNYRNFGDF